MHSTKDELSCFRKRSHRVDFNHGLTRMLYLSLGKTACGGLQIKHFSISEASARLTIPESEILYFEKKGLLPLFERDEAVILG